MTSEQKAQLGFDDLKVLINESALLSRMVECFPLAANFLTNPEGIYRADLLHLQKGVSLYVVFGIWNSATTRPLFMASPYRMFQFSIDPVLQVFSTCPEGNYFWVCVYAENEDSAVARVKEVLSVLQASDWIYALDTLKEQLGRPLDYLFSGGALDNEDRRLVMAFNILRGDGSIVDGCWKEGSEREPKVASPHLSQEIRFFQKPSRLVWNQYVFEALSLERRPMTGDITMLRHADGQRQLALISGVNSISTAPGYPDLKLKGHVFRPECLSFLFSELAEALESGCQLRFERVERAFQLAPLDWCSPVEFYRLIYRMADSESPYSVDQDRWFAGCESRINLLFVSLASQLEHYRYLLRRIGNGEQVPVPQYLDFTYSGNSRSRRFLQLCLGKLPNVPNPEPATSSAGPEDDPLEIDEIKY